MGSRARPQARPRRLPQRCQPSRPPLRIGSRIVDIAHAWGHVAKYRRAFAEAMGEVRCEWERYRRACAAMRHEYGLARAFCQRVLNVTM